MRHRVTTNLGCLEMSENNDRPSEQPATVCQYAEIQGVRHTVTALSGSQFQATGFTGGHDFVQRVQMLDINPETTKVVLIGTSKYPKDRNLHSLPQVSKNIQELLRGFSNPKIIGIPRKNIRRIVNERTPSKVLVELDKELKKAQETIIIYYAGHGLLDEELKLHLTTQDTTRVNVTSNGINYERVRKKIKHSKARRKILILDCCYSGIAVHLGEKPPISLPLENIEIEGTYIITSSPANEEAEAHSLRGEAYTAFSGELLRVLKHGIDNGKAIMTLSEIYENIEKEFKSRKLPKPQQLIVKDMYRLAFAYNRKFEKPQPYPVPLPRPPIILRRNWILTAALAILLFITFASKRFFSHIQVIIRFLSPPVVSTPAPLANKFQVGDKVRVKEGVEGIEGINPGDKGIVMQNDDDILEIKFLSGVIELVSTEDVEKVP